MSRSFGIGACSRVVEWRMFLSANRYPLRRNMRCAPAADEHATLGRVLDRVGDEILQQPPQQAPIGPHRERAGHELELQSLLLRERRELDLELAQELVDAEADDFRLHCAGIEPRDVEQRAEYFLDRVERGVDVADKLRIAAAGLPLDQAGDVEARGIERLQDVMARRGEEPGLRNIGLLGLAFGTTELGIEPRQFLGALLYASFERFIGACELLRRLHARRD